MLAERTNRRIKALELQNAIKAQVEERERIRKMELEKTLMEERRQEEKLRQQMESNEQRYEEEQRKTREKLEREQRKQELMRIAIEKARQEAEMEKSKKKRSILTSECESPEPCDDMPNNENIATTRTKEPSSPINDKMESDDHDTDDGEKILIGTPIKMRKKTLNKSQKVPLSAKKEVSVQSDKEANTTPETNVDGIALVLQTLPPIMPILSNDIINLNQNINTLNTSNIQLAVMLAHQMQQLNTTIAQNQNQNQLPELSKTFEANASDEKHPSSRSDCNDSTAKDVCKQCTGFNRLAAQQQEPNQEKVRKIFKFKHEMVWCRID